MSIQLNVLPVQSDGQPVQEPVITLFMYAANGQPAPMEPRIRNQTNFYVADIPYAPVGFPPPYAVYGTVTGKGLNTQYFGPINWDGKSTLNIPVTVSFKRPFRITPRTWKGNMCGVHIPGLSDVGTGGPIDLVLSWFYPRYPAGDRAIIRSNWASKGIGEEPESDKGLGDVLLSWPDARSWGMSEDEFIGYCLELMNLGFRPCVFLSSKDFDPWHYPTYVINNTASIRAKLAAIRIPRVSLFWEGSIWLTKEEAQLIINAMYADFLAVGTKVYIHLQEGYISFGQETIGDFWWKQVGKLHGILYQKRLSENVAQFLDSISDCLQRFCGGWGMPDDNGIDGNPFDMIALELNAMNQFNNGASEQSGIDWGTVAMNAPHCFGPNGVEAKIMGRGNG